MSHDSVSHRGIVLRPTHLCSHEVKATPGCPPAPADGHRPLYPRPAWRGPEVRAHLTAASRHGALLTSAHPPRGPDDE
jgi:hypothetical protein